MNLLLKTKPTTGASNSLTSKSTYEGSLPIDLINMSRSRAFRAAIVKDETLINLWNFKVH